MTAIGLFAKPPLPGRVKTRLAAQIGHDKATLVYRHCLEHALEAVHGSGLEFRVFLSEVCDDPLFRNIPCLLQKGGDLGERMLNAIEDLLAGGRSSAMIIGSDCLDLGSEHLRRAALALSDHELALIPAKDGGFALIGCRKTDSAIFRSVAWSTDRVTEQTVANAKGLGYRVALLDSVRDIDTLHDLENYPQLLALVDSPRCSTRC